MDKNWRRDGDSEDDLKIRYREESDVEEPQSQTTSFQRPSSGVVQPKVIDSDDSENIPQAIAPEGKSLPCKINPSEIHYTLGDKTT